MKINNLDRNEVYGLERIKKDAVKFDMLKAWLVENTEYYIGHLKDLDNYPCIKYMDYLNKWVISSQKPTKCALTLFELDITDYQVDCSELSDVEINILADIIESNNHILWKIDNQLDTSKFHWLKYFSGGFFMSTECDNKTTITYDKFIELFGGKQIKQAEKELSEIIGTDVTKPVKYKTNSLNIRLSNIEFKQITDSISDLLDYKNKKYGNSALEPLNIFANKCKTGQRLDDKLARVKNSSELKKNDVADLIGYLILTCKENNWTNFDEFKD